MVSCGAGLTKSTRSWIFYSSSTTFSGAVLLFLKTSTAWRELHWKAKGISRDPWPLLDFPKSIIGNLSACWSLFRIWELNWKSWSPVSRKRTIILSTLRHPAGNGFTRPSWLPIPLWTWLGRAGFWCSSYVTFWGRLGTTPHCWDWLVCIWLGWQQKICGLWKTYM